MNDSVLNFLQSVHNQTKFVGSVNFSFTGGIDGKFVVSHDAKISCLIINDNGTMMLNDEALHRLNDVDAYMAIGLPAMVVHYARKRAPGNTLKLHSASAWGF